MYAYQISYPGYAMTAWAPHTPVSYKLSSIKQQNLLWQTSPPTAVLLLYYPI